MSQTSKELKGLSVVLDRLVYLDDPSELRIDGDGIVGKEPTLTAGKSFSYNSYHNSPCNCFAQGSFHGTDSSGAIIQVRIPKFHMNIPPNTEGSNVNEVKLI